MVCYAQHSTLHTQMHYQHHRYHDCLHMHFHIMQRQQQQYAHRNLCKWDVGMFNTRTDTMYCMPYTASEEFKVMD